MRSDNLKRSMRIGVDGTDGHTYEELAKFDAFLFPTYWNDEGFPGAIVDAFTA